MIKKILRGYGLYFAWIIALIGTVLSLFASEILGLKPCNFCWYQRVFLFPLAIVLGIATYKRNFEVISYVLALPLIGAFIAFAQTMFSYFNISSFCGSECIQNNVKLFGFIDFSILSFFGFTSIFLIMFYTKKASHFEKLTPLGKIKSKRKRK